MHRHCLLSTTVCGWYCFHNCKSCLKVRQPVLCSLLTRSLFSFTLHANTTPLVFPMISGWLAQWSGITSTLFSRVRGTPNWSGFQCYHYFGGGAWYIRLEKAQTSMRKELKDSVPAKAFPGKALARVPRQGTGKVSQAGHK